MAEHSVYFHVDLDAFFASVEQRDNPQYRGKPLIIGLVGPRSVVSTCSYEARKYGVHSAMPTLQAYRLCPNGIYIPGDMAKYARVSHQVMDIIREYAPSMHQVSIDEASLDMTGTQRLFGPPRQLAMKIKQRIKDEVGITLSIGIASSPFIAKMASDYNKPDGLCLVSPGKEQVFIDAIGLEKLWGLGKSGLAMLNANRITTPAQVRQIDMSILREKFGNSFSTYLYHACRGQDIGLMYQPSKTHSISTESTFVEDLTTEEALHQVLLGMSKEIMERSFEENCMARTVGMKLRWGADFHTISVQETPEDPILNANQIYNIAKRLLASKWKSGQGIRLIGLGLYQLYSGDKPLQDSLFSEEEHKRRDLDKVVHKLGVKGVRMMKASELAGPVKDRKKGDQ
ncbi:MAG: DNA polymerase IV [Sphaerochaetaceae bacterium]|nr:DNA polymerase IV [Sphaerochaetaceae bacterium]